MAEIVLTCKESQEVIFGTNGLITRFSIASCNFTCDCHMELQFVWLRFILYHNSKFFFQAKTSDDSMINDKYVLGY